MFLTSSKMPYPSESKTTRCTTQYFVNFLKQSGTSKQKWNLMNKKLGPPVNNFLEEIKSDFEIVQFADDTIILYRYEPREIIATKIEIISLQTDS